MPYTGYGYVLGARAIEEQGGILAMLHDIECKGSLIAWGLSELFILGDDRYIDGYAKVQAGILNYAENTEPEKLDILFRRLSRFVVTEVNDEYRHKYLGELFEKLSSSNFERVKDYLQSVGMNSSQSEQNKIEEIEANSSQDKEREDPLDKLFKAKEEAQRRLDLENKSAARKTIINALQEVQKHKYGIWSSNFSSKINEIRNLLTESYNDSSEFIKDIRELIINEPYFEEWVIADQIINLLRNINDEQEKQLILLSVLEHIELMVRTSTTYYDRYSWLIDSAEKTTPDQQDKLLLELLIWFLNHPSLVVKNRTIEILVWLGSIMHEKIVQALVNEITSEGYKISRELSASVIHQISNLNPSGFSGILKNSIEQNEQKLLDVKHFMIRNTILDSLKELKLHGASDLDEIITKFEQTFISSTKSNGDIIIDEEYLKPIEDYLYRLNDLEILTKEFAKTLLSQIKEIAPLSIEECQKASGYINRSFNNHNDIVLVSDFDALLRYALNIAIDSCVTLKSKEKVADILRFYQPTFPENKLQVKIYSSGEQFETALKNIFEGGKVDFEKLLINGDIPLNYFCNKYTESRSSPNEKIELTAYLIPLDKYNKKGYTYPWPTFSENSYPDNAPYEEDEIAIPLFLKSEYIGNVTGSELVPAVLNSNINELIPGLKNDITSIYWRIGRNWNNRRQGVAQQTGYFSTTSQNTIDVLKTTHKLIWWVYYGYDSKYIDVFEQKEIKR